MSGYINLSLNCHKLYLMINVFFHIANFFGNMHALELKKDNVLTHAVNLMVR